MHRAIAMDKTVVLFILVAVNVSLASFRSRTVEADKNRTLAEMIAAACNGSTPGEVRLAPGTYNVSSSIMVPSHCTIDGPRTAMVLNPSANFSAFAASTPVTDLTFEGFTLNGGGINLRQGGDHITVNGVRFYRTGSTAVNIQDDASYVQIINNECESPQTYYCFGVGSGKGANPADHDWTVANNTMTGCLRNCILLEGGNRIAVTGNTAEMIAPGDTAIEVGVYSSHATVTGNVVDMTPANTKPNVVGISTRSANYVAVTGNVVEGDKATESHCYLAWHGSPSETQPEQYVSYSANVAANCSIGFKTFEADHFSFGGFDFQGDTTPVNLDPSPTDYVELPSRGDRTIVFPAGAHIYFGSPRPSKISEPR